MLDLLPHEWQVLTMIDGRRDLRGIAAALGEQRVRGREDRLRPRSRPAWSRCDPGDRPANRTLARIEDPKPYLTTATRSALPAGRSTTHSAAARAAPSPPTRSNAEGGCSPASRSRRLGRHPERPTSCAVPRRPIRSLPSCTSTSVRRDGAARRLRDRGASLGNEHPQARTGVTGARTAPRGARIRDAAVQPVLEAHHRRPRTSAACSDELAREPASLVFRPVRARRCAGRGRPTWRSRSRSAGSSGIRISRRRRPRPPRADLPRSRRVGARLRRVGHGPPLSPGHARRVEGDGLRVLQA